MGLINAALWELGGKPLAHGIFFMVCPAGAADSSPETGVKKQLMAKFTKDKINGLHVYVCFVSDSL